MSTSFKIAASREETNAEKYVLREKLFGTKDVIPLWVADMDIDTPAFVLESVKKRLGHLIVGYEDVPSSAFEAQIKWLQKRHGVAFEVQDMLHSHSVVASMNVAIEAFTNKSDKVIVQTPVYPPFFKCVKEHERELLLNPLKKLEDGSYTFDLDDLRSKIDAKTKLLLLCSPHNPVGRVWRREELEALFELCHAHNIVVFSDEIHSDLIYPPHKHIPFASLNARARDISLTAIGVGKTFNMAGFAMSSVAIPNKDLQEKFRKVYDKIHFAQGNVLSHVAFESAYKDGNIWLEDLIEHLQRNAALLERLCSKYAHVIKVTSLEGTYLAWLDCREMQFGDRELKEFFINESKLGLSPGLSFGREGSGYMRLNFALSHAKMLEVISLLQNALERRFGSR
ncbi:MAG TPA: aminotransferase class I/II [Sulfurimonas sp. UBA12504]|nr:MAG: aminotransferase class I/II [Sulfurimonas sp. GWF2_37_8]DAB29872.1 MAG TPA: aminotransferase class I/II [Sulfurimonas sp. UBA12504]